MASVTYKADAPSPFWLIQCSRGRGKSPASMRWRPPQGSLWSHAKCEKEAWKAANAMETQIQAGTYRTKRELREEEARRQAEEEQKVTLSQFFNDTFLPDRALYVTKHTLRQYESQYHRHIEEPFGDRKICDIQSVELDRWQNGLLQNMSFGSATNQANFFRWILKEALRLGLIDFDPFTRVRRPQRPKDLQQKEKDIDPEFLVRISEGAMQEPPVRKCLFLLAIDTGCRIGELLSFQWQDLQDGGILVQRQVIRENGELTITNPKTLSSLRYIHLGESTLQALADLRQSVQASPDSWIFPGLAGMPLSQNAASNWLHDLCDKVGVPRLNWHRFRHSSISRAIRAGADPVSTARRAGHSSVNTTMRIYAHAHPEAIRRAGQLARQALEEAKQKLDKGKN